MGSHEMLVIPENPAKFPSIVTGHSLLAPILNCHHLDEIENPRFQHTATQQFGAI